MKKKKSTSKKKITFKLTKAKAKKNNCCPTCGQALKQRQLTTFDRDGY